MHDGSLRTLEEVIEHYDRGGTRNRNLDEEIRPLGLTPAEKRQIVAFLEALTEGPSDR
jgi:cytochrome c peroxidase